MSEVLTKSDRVSQKALQDLSDVRQALTLRRTQKSDLRKTIEKLEYSEALLNDELFNLINKGHKISRGRFLAKLLIKKTMPRVAWKQVFIQFVPNGEAKADKLMDEREPNESPYVELSMRE